MTKELLLERMTSPEIKKAIENGYDTVLVIAGSIEQHGPHLPTSTDTSLGYAIGELTAAKMGNTLLAPVIRPGMSEHHMAFKGTITLSKETFVAVVKDTVHSLARHGFKRIAVTFSHGGNSRALAETLPVLAAELPDHDILSLENAMDAFTRASASISEQDGISNEESGVHAGEFETSCFLGYDAEQVRMDKLEKGFTADFTKPNPALEEALAKGMHAVTENGILGDARKANEARGKKYLDATAEFMAKHFTKVSPK